MSTNPTLTELVNAQKRGFVFGGTQGEDPQMIERMRAAYARMVTERENFLRFCEENTFDVVLRNKDGNDLAVRLSEETSNIIYGAINEELIERLRQREAGIIAELLRMEKDAAVGYNQQERLQNSYESAILALCTPAATSSATPALEATTTLPLPAGQRLFVTPATRPSAAPVV